MNDLDGLKKPILKKDSDTEQRIIANKLESTLNLLNLRQILKKSVKLFFSALDVP
ncbi:MAG TPA: hypothetical protein VGI82_11390 [Chitinophagaceae bacterium]|jgi:hypothetical protein